MTKFGRLESRDRGNKINGIRQHEFPMAVSPSLAHGLIAPSFRSIRWSDSTSNVSPDPLNDWLRSFRSYRSNKNHALLLTINSTEIATLPPPLCPADNVLPSLTSLPILHDRYEQANYSYHPSTILPQFVSTTYPWQSSWPVHRLCFFFLPRDLLLLPTLSPIPSISIDALFFADNLGWI